MPTHLNPAEFEQNFPISEDVFPEAIDNENYVDALLFNSLAGSIETIEEYLVLFRANIEAVPMESFEGAEGLKIIPIPDGIYLDGKTVTANDGDLLAENIKIGTVIFGVTGTLEAMGESIGISIPNVSSIEDALVYSTPPNQSINGTMPTVAAPAVSAT